MFIVILQFDWADKFCIYVAEIMFLCVKLCLKSLKQCVLRVYVHVYVQ
jgi:hypothetical protein